MINYNPKDWFTFIFRLHKSDTFRTLLPTMTGIALYTLILVFVENYYNFKADNKITKIITVHTLLSFVISMLLVFRTNTAYDRWWEGRKEWGALVNTSRNFSMKLKSFFSQTDDLVFFQQKLISFPYALKNHLRNITQEIDEEDVLGAYQKMPHQHLPLHIATEMYQKLTAALNDKKITNEQFLTLDSELKQWMEICGKCERIKNTPIPFSYNVFIKKFIFIYVMSLPPAIVPIMGGYAVPIAVFIFYVLASLELLSDEI